MSQAVLGHSAAHGYTRPATPALRAVGMMVEFSHPDDVYAAATQMRNAGYTRWDVHTPYPMHGLDKAMGVPFTLLPIIVFIGGVTGCLTGVFLTHYTAAFEMFQNWWLPTNLSGYALNSSGKPLLSTPAFIPPIFELTVLFSALTCVITMLVMNNLPTLSSALLANARFRQVTTDKFFVVVDAQDPKFDLTSTAAFLRELGGSEPVRIEERAQSPAPPKWFLAAGVVATVIAMIPLVVIAKARNSKTRSPRYHIVQDMDNQERYKAQMYNPAFLDGRAMRPEPAGTVARGDIRKIAADTHLTEGVLLAGEGAQWAAAFPAHIPVTRETIERGQDRFAIYCAPCHGLDGRGNGAVNARNSEGRPGWEAWVLPTSLHDQTVRDRAHGHIFNTISNGIRTMPPYSASIAVEDRWAIVAYVRALQRSSAAKLDDVPADIRTELERRQP